MLVKKSESTLRYSDMLEILIKANNFEWEELDCKEKVLCETFNQDIFWAIISAEYFPIKGYQYALNNDDGEELLGKVKFWMDHNLKIESDALMNVYQYFFRISRSFKFIDKDILRQSICELSDKYSFLKEFLAPEVPKAQ
jgi:hypothetical protein